MSETKSPGVLGLQQQGAMGKLESRTVDIYGLEPVTTVLYDQEHGSIRTLCRELAARLPHAELNDERTLTAIEYEARHLPRRLAEILIHFRRVGNEYGALLLRNMPIDQDLVPTPADGKLAAWTQASLSSLVQLMSMSWLGDVISYTDEKEGSLVQDVAPVVGAERRQENTGSVLLEMHTEDGFHPYKPDFLSLLCLRSDHDRIACTAVASIVRALPLLSSACVELLQAPLYRIRYASSFCRNDVLQYSARMPVLSGSLQQPDLSVDFHAMEGLSDDATWALEQLRTAMTAVLAGAVLEPGDMIIVDNRAAVHARTAFAPRYDGHDRWLRRSFAVTDYSRSRPARACDSHVCAPLGVIDYMRRGRCAGVWENASSLHAPIQK